MAYVMGALKIAMEWATVPVLAVAMCLPHGALVYWLSSSSMSLLQVPSLAIPTICSTDAHIHGSLSSSFLQEEVHFACQQSCCQPSALP